MDATPSTEERAEYIEGGRKSIQLDAWPARKQNEKIEMKRRRVRMAIKVVVAVVVVIGAVALGLGITKAVKDGKKKDGS